MSGAIVVVSTGGTIAMRPDPATGKLVPTGQVVKAGSPVTIVFR